MKPFFFNLPILPTGFVFPSAYETLAQQTAVDILPWRFLYEDMPKSLSYYGALLQKFPDLSLVPFAIINDQSGTYNDGWIVLACFDGTNHLGNPPVYIYDYSNPRVSPVENNSYANFSEWLAAAQTESARYKAELLG
jgi:hypothetical protein